MEESKNGNLASRSILKGIMPEMLKKIEADAK
jgi:hypothetical protein